MEEFLNDQYAVNIFLIFFGVIIVLMLLKLSIMQDAIKDGIDDLLKKK